MAATLQFVDDVSSSAGLRLDLNVLGEQMLREGFDFSPPPLRRVEVDSSLRDGTELVGSSYGNREIRLPLRMLVDCGVGADAMDALKTALARETDRSRNYIKWKRDNTSIVKFFATQRMSPREVDAQLTQPTSSWELVIPAFPFALGERQDLATVTVNNDPAATLNPMRLDLSSVLGDVPTPLIMWFQGGATNYTSFPFLPATVGYRGSVLIAIRSRGNPANLGNVAQCEAGTIYAGTDTSLMANDPLMSGSGNNYLRTTFATVPELRDRWWIQLPGAAAEEASGEYRLFLRGRKTVIDDEIYVQVSTQDSYNDHIATPLTRLQDTNKRAWFDLGLIQIGSLLTPGAGGTARPADVTNLAFVAERRVGTGSLDWDAVMAVPSDESMFEVEMGDRSAYVVVDGFNRALYKMVSNGPFSATGAIMSEPLSPIGGGFPYVTPGVLNRIFFVPNTDNFKVEDLLTSAHGINMHYYPYYLMA